MSEWCQNKKCPEKRNQNQIRGSKGAKYYQSNKANGYGNGNFCTLGCQTEWDNEYMDRAIDALGVRIYEAKKINLDDAWYVEYRYGYYNNESNCIEYQHDEEFWELCKENIIDFIDTNIVPHLTYS